jgi:hypothetical protein
MQQTEYSASYALLRVGDLHALWIFKRYGCDALASAMKARKYRLAAVFGLARDWFCAK